MAAEIHVNDVGLAFRPAILDDDGGVVNISTASSVKIVLEKPGVDGGDAEAVEFTATFYTDGTDGIAQYVTQAGDLDRPGPWRVQAVAYFGAGRPLHSDIHKFKVFANLKADD